MATRILVAALFTPVLFALIFLAPPLGTAALVAVITTLASYELLRATRVAHHSGMYVYTCLTAALIPLGVYVTRTYQLGSGYTGVLLCGFVLTCALFISAIRRFDGDDPIPLEHLMVCFFAGMVLPIFLSALVSLRTMEHGRYMVLLPILCAFTTDAGAYFAGVFFGRHRGVTKVSPNKSLEGYVGGILSGGVFLLLYGLLLRRFTPLDPSLPLLSLYGLVGSCVTALGDLSFSLIKRQYGIKDYGNLLPGHGGMLDRFDSMTFAAPAMWLLVSLLPAFPEL